MSEEPLVRVEHVSKKFCRSLKRSLWYGMRDLGGELLGQRGDRRLDLRRGEFLALDDVSFELRAGECLGLIGTNGAGKSTLLKMLNGLVRPDAGRIEMRGRVGALIELGAGFNPILTGRENIYVNGAVLGMGRREIDARFDEIVAYSELESFIDSPLQSYSSGMRVRLAFAVAVQMAPDVLLIDEVLAVGDAAFRAKCIGTILEIREHAAIVFVSHNMGLVSRVSTHALVLDKGRVAYVGDEPARGISSYYEHLSLPAPRQAGSDDAPVRVQELRLQSGGRSDDRGTLDVASGDDLALSLRVAAPGAGAPVAVIVAIVDAEHGLLLQCDSRRSGFTLSPGEVGDRISVVLPELALNDGRYQINLHFNEVGESGRLGRHLYSARHVATLAVRGDGQGSAPLQVRGSWSRG